MENVISGWLCLDKPAGISSNAVLSHLKRIFKTRMGYIGTLDPFATGVLPVALGEARKFIPYVNENKKTYIFKMIFGISTDSLDIDGEKNGESDKIPSKNELLSILKTFIGVQKQMPPKFSAIKINGRRACDLVRQGNEISLKEKEITVFSLDLISEALNTEKEAELQVVCSKGTYVRSLARDIAEKLGTLAYVKSLRRIQSGFFSVKNIISLEKLQKIEDTSMRISFILPVESPLDGIPALYVSEIEAKRLQDGLRISYDGQDILPSNVLVFDRKNSRFRGIGYISSDQTVKAVRMCSLI
ncbi:MAG: tRNA pseudouridine(55) synthase TruB [Alphaproteobacteria bacterium]|nr:tRNA pseudouridine(55) synthase TruB [Alphaproteobacteria bacterium]